MKILCFGSLNIDYTYKVDHFVQRGETLAAGSMDKFGGGKGLNQSIALARAGMEVYHAGAVGRDGSFLLEQLKAAGVNTEYVAILEESHTGHAIIQNNQDGDNCIMLYGGANREITPEQADRVFLEFQEGDCLLLQNEINQLPYLMRRAHERGMKIVLNPSPMDRNILDLPLELVDYFILNEIEAGQMLGEAYDGMAEGERMAELLHQKYASATIVLTLGEAGSVLHDSRTMIRQGKYNVRAVDTTAAGDTFTGFFLGCMLKGSSGEEAMDMAAKAAAIAVTRHGAAPSIPRMKEVLEFGKE